MNCQPDPSVTCGDTYNDSCVVITGIWPACFPTTSGPCYRQSDFNSAVGNLLCNLATVTFGSSFTLPVSLPIGVTSILSSITLTGLITPVGCNSLLGINPIKTTVAAELQNIYNLLCANLPVSLNTPISIGAGPGLNLKCLQDPCGNPIATLGNLLQALINEVCEDPGVQYTVILNQAGATSGHPPVATILEDTLDPTGSYLTWNQTGVGTYTLTASGPLVGIFNPLKTFILVGPLTVLGQLVVASITSPSVITFVTGTAGSGPADGIFINTSLQIKIYP